jgi:hypothetical protein
MIKTVTYNMDLGPKAQGKITATPPEDIKLAKVRGRKDMGRGSSLWAIDTTKVNPKVVRTFALEYAVNFSPGGDIRPVPLEPCLARKPPLA